jgi:hypothetical protein
MRHLNYERQQILLGHALKNTHLKFESNKAVFAYSTIIEAYVRTNPAEIAPICTRLQDSYTHSSNDVNKGVRLYTILKIRQQQERDALAIPLINSLPFPRDIRHLIFGHYFN